MEEQRRAIEDNAKSHYAKLCKVQPTLDSLLFSKQSHETSTPFGSFSNGTYTGQSDIDVYITNNSTDYWTSDNRASNLVSHLKKQHNIDAVAHNNIVIFNHQGVKINAVVLRQPQITKTVKQDKLIRQRCSNLLYLDVVRFLKLFAATYLERFPNGPSGSKPIYPGSHFYSASAYVAMDLLKTSTVVLSYPAAIRHVASFIGEGRYMDHKQEMENLGIDPSKIGGTKGVHNREVFNKCFRALVAHIDKGVPLPGMSASSIPDIKPLEALLSFIKDDEIAREQKEKEKKAAAEKETQEKLAASLARMSFYDKYYDEYYNDYSDDDDGYIGTNGKRYNDYSEWYDSDSFDEDWHD